MHMYLYYLHNIHTCITYAHAYLIHTNSCTLIHVQIASASTKMWFRAFLLLAGFYFSYRFLEFALRVQWEVGYSSSNIYRFNALETRSGALATAPGIESFGVIFNACPLDDNNTILVSDGPIMYVIYDRVVTMNGWHITTSKSKLPEDDPVKFKIEAGLSDMQVYNYLGNIHKTSSSDADRVYTVNRTSLLQHLNQSKWLLVGSSYTVTHQSLNRLDLYERPVNVTTSRGALVEFDARIPWTDILFFVSVSLTFAVCSWTMLFFSLRHMHEYNHMVVSGSFNLAGALMFTSGISGLAIMGDTNQVWLILYSMCNISLGVGLVVMEQRITIMTFLTGFFFILFIVIDSFVVYKVPVVGQRDIPSEGTILVLLSTYVYLRRKYTLRSAWRLIEKDIQAYNDKWQSIVTDPKYDVALKRIRMLAQRVKCDTVLRQCNRARVFKPGLDATKVSLSSLSSLGVVTQAASGMGSVASGSSGTGVTSGRLLSPASGPVADSVVLHIRDQSSIATEVGNLDDPDVSLGMERSELVKDVDNEILRASSQVGQEGGARVMPCSRIYDGLVADEEDDSVPGMVRTIIHA
jgi:hypothetical protein